MSAEHVGWAFRQECGSPTRKLVLVALADRVNKDTLLCCPHIETLAKDCDLSERATRQAVKDLCDAEVIKRSRSRKTDGSLSGYRYEFPQVQNPAPPPAGDAGSPPAGDAAPSSNREGTSNRRTTTTVVVPADAPERAPSLVKVQGRNLPFDALREACGIREDSPRMVEVSTALFGTAKGGDLGIRDFAWRELRDRGIVGDGPALEGAIASLIRARAQDYLAVMGGATLTPLALRKWWVDLPGMRRGNGGTAMDAVRAALDEQARMEEGR